MNDFLEITSDIKISLSAIQFKFSRSSGKGGQNVNKVSTKVELLYPVSEIKNLSITIYKNLIQKYSSRINSDEMIQIISQETRSQWKNRQLAIEKLQSILIDCSIEEKDRIKTKPSKTTKVKRIEEKKKHGKIKLQRQQSKSISTDD